MARLARGTESRSDAARTRHQAAGLLPQPMALLEMLHRRNAVARADGVVDCVEGASVQLIKNGDCVAVTASDNYGDFKFDRLERKFWRLYHPDLCQRPHQNRRDHSRLKRQSRRDPAIIMIATTLRPFIAFLICAVSCAAAQAQQYPSRPVHFIVGFAAGSGPDVRGARRGASAFRRSRAEFHRRESSGRQRHHRQQRGRAIGARRLHAAFHQRFRSRRRPLSTSICRTTC